MSLALVLALTSSMTTVGCPSFIDDNQTLKGVPSGWTAEIFNRSRKFKEAQLFMGPPINFLLVRGVAKRDGSTRWEFDGSDIWVTCRYENSAVALTKNLGKLESCVFRPARGGSRDGPSFVCVAKSEKTNKK